MLCPILDALCFPKYMPLPTIPNECSNSPNPLFHPPAMCHTSATLSPFYTASSRHRGDLVYRQKGREKTCQAHLSHSLTPKPYKPSPAHLCWWRLAYSPHPGGFPFHLNLSHCSSSPILSRHRKQIIPFPQLLSIHLKAIILFPLGIFTLRNNTNPLTLAHCHQCGGYRARCHTVPSHLHRQIYNHSHTHILYKSWAESITERHCLPHFAHISGPRWLKSLQAETESCFLDPQQMGKWKWGKPGCPGLNPHLF